MKYRDGLRAERQRDALRWVNRAVSNLAMTLTPEEVFALREAQSGAPLVGVPGVESLRELELLSKGGVPTPLGMLVLADLKAVCPVCDARGRIGTHAFEKCVACRGYGVVEQRTVVVPLEHARHDRETLERLESAFEAVGPDLVETVLGLRNAAAELQRWVGGDS